MPIAKGIFVNDGYYTLWETLIKIGNAAELYWFCAHSVIFY